MKPGREGFWRRFWRRVAGDSVDRAAVSLLAVFRFTSWALTSLAYILTTEPAGPNLVKSAVVAALLLYGIVVTRMLGRITGDVRQIATLALAEALSLPLLLLPTTGLDSPFVWYALNPLLVAAAYLPLGYTWGVVCAFMVTSYGAMQTNPATSGHLMSEYADILLIFALVTVVVRMQARSMRSLEAQQREIVRQQRALQEAYDALAARGETLEALAQFQREAISCIGHADLYWTVSRSVQRRFQPAWTGVMYPVSEPEPGLVKCPWLEDAAGCRLVTEGVYQEFDWSSLWQETNGPEARPQAGLRGLDGGRVHYAPLHVDTGRVRGVLAVGGLAPERQVELEVWLEYIRQLAAKLTAADRTRRTLDYLSDVQQLVESAGVARAEGDLLELVTMFAQQLTGAAGAAFWPADPAEPDVLRVAPSIIKGGAGVPPAEEFAGHAAEWWAASPAAMAGLDRYHAGDGIWHVCYTVVRSSERRYGVLLVAGARPFGDDIDVVRTMGFLGYLAGAMLERQQAEDLHGRLLVAEEQARIAAEIHDGVSQSLFSLVYGLQGAIGSLSAGKPEDAQRTLSTLREVAAQVSREIRSSIYQLTQGEDRGTFVRAIRACLDDIENLYGINTTLEVTGSEDNLSPAIKRAVYRIVREASSNAARHGQGSELQVRMALTPQQTRIDVADNGVGFVPPSIEDLAHRGPGTRTGLGLLNMRQLALSFNGSISIDSAPGRGTRIAVRIPDLITDETTNGG